MGPQFSRGKKQTRKKQEKEKQKGPTRRPERTPRPYRFCPAGSWPTRSPAKTSPSVDHCPDCAGDCRRRVLVALEPVMGRTGVRIKDATGRGRRKTAGGACSRSHGEVAGASRGTEVSAGGAACGPERYYRSRCYRRPRRVGGEHAGAEWSRCA